MPVESYTCPFPRLAGFGGSAVARSKNKYVNKRKLKLKRKIKYVHRNIPAARKVAQFLCSDSKSSGLDCLDP